MRLIRTLLLILSLLAAGIVHADDDVVARFEALGLQDRPATITFTLGEMVAAILKETGDRPFSAHQFLGYSGASFADMDRYKAEFTARVLALNQETLRRWGPEAVTVYILGGTYDGFGFGYNILKELMDSGKIKGGLVTGMASNEAMRYHLEGMEKGWGHVISPDQKILFMKETFTDSQGHRSWELKTSEAAESDTPRVLKDLSRYATAGFMSFNVFGGGFQAFNETLEMILESRNRPQQVEINLYTGHTPGKVKKDTGYRAADMLGYVLAKNRYLLNQKIDVQLTSSTGTRGLPAFTATREYRQLRRDMDVAGERLEALKKEEPTPEVQAQMNYFGVLQKLDSLPLKEIENFRERSSRQLAEARDRLSGLPVLDGLFKHEAVQDHLDVCLTCTDDGTLLLKTYQEKSGCGGDLTGENKN